LLEDREAFLGARHGAVAAEQRGHVDGNPASRTQRAKRATSGLIPGISLMTMTAGPLPATCTRLATPSNVISRGVKSSSGSSCFMLRAAWLHPSRSRL
jgi:hypothetical protein